MTATPSPEMETPGAPELGQWPGEGRQGGPPGPGVPSPDPPVSLRSACQQQGTVPAWLPPEGFSSAGLPGDTVVILSFQMNGDTVSHIAEKRGLSTTCYRSHTGPTTCIAVTSLCVFSFWKRVVVGRQGRKCRSVAMLDSASPGALKIPELPGAAPPE